MKAFKDLSVPHFDNKSFIERNSSTIVVCVQDELESILVEEGFTNKPNDVILLLNANRLDNAAIDPKVVADILRKRFSERNVTSPFEGLTDDEIFMNIRSRSIQSLTELDRYAEYLAGSLAASMKREDQKKLAEVQTEAIESA